MRSKTAYNFEPMAFSFALPFDPFAFWVGFHKTTLSRNIPLISSIVGHYNRDDGGKMAVYKDWHCSGI